MQMLFGFKCLVILCDKHSQKGLKLLYLCYVRSLCHVLVENYEKQQLRSSKTQTCYKF